MTALGTIQVAEPTVIADASNVALVHDWLPTIGGAEHVLSQMSRAFPGAHIHTLFDFLTEEERRYVTRGNQVTTSGLNALPGVQKYYRHLLLQATRAVENFDLRDFDCVVSSSAALAKGVITGVEQPHVAYIHSPPRYAWDLTQEYLSSISGIGAGLKRMAAHRMLHKFRLWDQRTINTIDHVVANSQFIARRIAKTYRRKAQVIYPPVATNRFTLNPGARDDYFVTASRFVPYKRMDLIVAAFNERPDLKLRVIGDGPDMARIKAMAKDNVEIMGRLPADQMNTQFRNARAFIFAAFEDFGIVPVEAQACGTPVIAYNKGGAAETVRGLDHATPTGVFFERQNVPALLGALDTFLSVEGDLKPRNIRRNAERFSADVFRHKLTSLVQHARSEVQ